MKRMSAELSRAKQSYNIQLIDERISEWKVELDIPDYGLVLAIITFPENFPFSPPTVSIPRIFHPNVFKDGTLCLSILHPCQPEVGDQEGLDEKWTPSIWMTPLLESVVSVLIEPNLDSPANIDAKNLFSSNLSEYRRRNEDLARLRENDKIKVEQEAAFEKSLMADQNKEKNDELKVRTALESKMKDDIDKTDARQKLSYEPDENSQDIIKIRFRCTGFNTARRFLATSPLSELLLFLRSEGFKSEEYKVLSAWPRRDVSILDPGASLQSLGFCAQEVLTLEAIGDGDTSE